MQIEKPGWYPDPSGRSDLYRWWTGNGWTNWMSSDSQAPPPEMSGSRAAVVQPRRQRDVARTGTLVGLSILVVLAIVAAMTMGGVMYNRQHPKAGQVITPFPSATPIQQVTHTLEVEGTRARMGQVTVDLPAGWRVHDVESYDFSPIHESFVQVPGGARDKVSRILIGVPVALPVSASTAEMKIQSALTTMIVAIAPTVSDLVDGTLDQVPDQQLQRAYQYRATMVHDTWEPGGRAEVRALIYQLDDDQWIFMMSVVPEDAPEEQQQAVAKFWQDLHLPQ